jgi:hypothetical protein
MIGQTIVHHVVDKWSLRRPGPVRMFFQCREPRSKARFSSSSRRASRLGCRSSPHFGVRVMRLRRLRRRGDDHDSRGDNEELSREDQDWNMHHPLFDALRGPVKRSLLTGEEANRKWQI